MCGIAGRVGQGRQPSLSQMVASLTHRGPDAEGVHLVEGCELGMRRLRVIDLSPSGDQPMFGARRDISLVYNGELYNHDELRRELRHAGHVFHSRTDTEVIVRGYEEWGDDVVLRLRGMFAFAIWDAAARRLLLARDRLGIKPLYLTDEQEGGLRFASEAHALGPLNTVDARGLASYLLLGWVGSGGTIAEGVRELPPGALLVHQDGMSSIRRYWTAEPRDEPADQDALGHALRESVSRHLVADVPVGVFLSAGLDSSVIAALGSEQGHDLRTFTVAYDQGPSEVAGASRLARELGVRHEVVRVSGSDMLAALPSVIADMDQPTVDGANSWVIARAVRGAGMTVALSGLGGDELFSGYSTFRRAPQIAAAGRRLPAPVLEGLSKLAGASGRTRWSRWRRALLAAEQGGLPAAYAGVRGLFAVEDLGTLWPGGRDILLSSDIDDVLETRQKNTVATLELENYLRYQLLRDTDTMSMAHSLEVRVPLLDDEVVRLALATRPARSGLSGKALLAAAAGPAVMAAAARPKETFTLPFERWLRGELAPWASGSLETLSRSSLGFDRTGLLQVEKAFHEGRVGWRSLWALAVLGAWAGQRGL